MEMMIGLIISNLFFLSVIMFIGVCCQLCWLFKLLFSDQCDRMISSGPIPLLYVLVLCGCFTSNMPRTWILMWVRWMCASHQSVYSGVTHHTRGCRYSGVTHHTRGCGYSGVNHHTRGCGYSGVNHHTRGCGYSGVNHHTRGCGYSGVNHHIRGCGYSGMTHHIRGCGYSGVNHHIRGCGWLITPGVVGTVEWLITPGVVGTVEWIITSGVVGTVEWLITPGVVGDSSHQGLWVQWSDSSHQGLWVQWSESSHQGLWVTHHTRGCGWLITPGGVGDSSHQGVWVQWSDSSHQGCGWLITPGDVGTMEWLITPGVVCTVEWLITPGVVGTVEWIITPGDVGTVEWLITSGVVCTVEWLITPGAVGTVEWIITPGDVGTVEWLNTPGAVGDSSHQGLWVHMRWCAFKYPVLSWPWWWWRWWWWWLCVAARRTGEPYISSEQTSGTVDRYSKVSLASKTSGAKIYYTLDGSRPSINSKVCHHHRLFTNTCATVKTIFSITTTIILTPPCWPSGLGICLESGRSRFKSNLWQYFYGSSDTSDLKIGTPVATLPGAWRYRVSSGTGRPGVSILWLGEVESWIYNFYLSVVAHKLSEQIHFWDTLVCCWDIEQTTNNTTILTSLPPLPPTTPIATSATTTTTTTTTTLPPRPEQTDCTHLVVTEVDKEEAKTQTAMHGLKLLHLMAEFHFLKTAT